jgi:hypothetical protein
MYKNMTYQQAKRIRSQSISSVLADQLIMGAGYGAAIKQTASAKWNAKVSGIKEKFDPLNIAKFLTGGSRLGPAILGKMLGRSRKDIEYFTGRARPVQYRGPKIGKTPGGAGGEDIGGMQSVLGDILTFLQKSHQDNMVMREKENNFREGQKHEDERRHEALLKALGGKKQTASPVKTKSSQPSFFEDIMDSVNKLIDKYKPMLEELSAFMKDALWPVLRMGLGQLGIFLIPVIAGTLFKMWWDNYRGEKSEQNIKEAQARGGDVAATATKEMERLRKEGDEISDPVIRDQMEAQQGIRDDAIARRDYYREDFLKHSGFKRKNNWFGNGFTYKDANGKEPSTDMMKAADQYAEEETQKIFTGQNKDPLNKFTFVKPVETKPAEPASKSTEAPKTSAAPAPVTPASAAVATKTVENRDLTLKAKAVTKTETTNNTNIKTTKKDQKRKIQMPSVRNNEETFARLIWDSTRVV